MAGTGEALLATEPPSVFLEKLLGTRGKYDSQTPTSHSMSARQMACILKPVLVFSVSSSIFFFACS
jgi:hypothetical protein